MGRYYYLSHKITKDQAAEIEKRLNALEDVDAASITEDGALLKVETKDEIFTEVMWRAVNICSNVVNGLELSFARFAYKEE